MGSTETWLEAFAQDELAPERVDAWVDRTAGAILAETPEVAEDATLSDLLRTAVRSHWLAFLAELGGPPRDVRLVGPAAEFASEVARRRVHLSILFKVYRIAQQATWRYLTDVVRERDDESVDDTEVLVRAWDRASGWIDASITASVDVHQAERDRILQGAAAQRLEQVRRALNGRVENVREFSALLGGHPISAQHTGIVLRSAEPDGLAVLEEAATRLAADLGAPHPLVVQPGGSELWCWASTRAVPDLAVIRDRAPELTDRGITACVGTAAEDLAGFVLTHREAQAAHRIALVSGAGPSLTLYPDVEVMALIEGSAEAAERFVRRTLGDLAESSENVRRLRETVAAVLEHGSVDAAARRLVVHKNTVRYRLARAEELLGRSISAAPIELALALRYDAAFGEER